MVSAIRHVVDAATVMARVDYPRLAATERLGQSTLDGNSPVAFEERQLLE